MVNKSNKSTGRGRDLKLLALFAFLAVGTILFVASTDVITLFSVAGLTLDATSSRGSPSDRGVDASTGQFRGEGNFFGIIDRFTGNLDDFFNQIGNNKIDFERPKAPNPPECRRGACSMMPPALGKPPAPVTLPVTPIPPVTVEPLPQLITVIDLRQGSTQIFIAVDGVKGGGGEPSSSVGLQGIPELIRDKVIVHERFHTPANGQTITGSLLLEWGHGNAVTVQQFLVANEFFDWFEFDLPQVIRGDGAITFDGKSEGEFIYRLTIPDDLRDKTTVIPVRLIINSQMFVVDGLTEIQIERPQEDSKTFSFAEFFRSIFTEIRKEFNA